MIKIKALESFDYSVDGINVTKFEKDKNYEIPRKVASLLQETNKIDIVPGPIENKAHEDRLGEIAVLEKTVIERDKTIEIKDKEISKLKKQLEKFTKKPTK